MGSVARHARSPGEALLGKLAPYVLLGVLQAGVVVVLLPDGQQLNAR